jgi:hypothetical protein
MVVRYTVRRHNGQLATGIDKAGANLLVEALAAIPAAAVRDAVNGSLSVLNDVLTESKSIAPFEDGYLKDSGFLAETDLSGSAWRLTIGYGGPAGPYMVRQHEDTSLNHPGPRALAKGASQIGQSKFLINPFNARTSELIAAASRYVAARLAGKPLPAPSRPHPKAPDEINSVKVRKPVPK